MTDGDLQAAAARLQQKIQDTLKDYGEIDAMLIEASDLLAQLSSALTQSQNAMKPAYVILEGLRLGVDWELAPPIKTEIARVAKLLEATLQGSAPAP
jgi:hypothetical protein